MKCLMDFSNMPRDVHPCKEACPETHASYKMTDGRSSCTRPGTALHLGEYGATHKLGRRKYCGGEAVGRRPSVGAVGANLRVAHWRPRCGCELAVGLFFLASTLCYGPSIFLCLSKIR